MINYKIRKIREVSTQKDYYFPIITNQGYITFEQIAEEIASKSTSTRADVASVLTALEELIARKLASSCIVRLGRLGTFRPTIQSKIGGVSNIEKCNASRISTVNCRFKSGWYLLREMKPENVTFKRV